MNPFKEVEARLSLAKANLKEAGSMAKTINTQAHHDLRSLVFAVDAQLTSWRIAHKPQLK